MATTYTFTLRSGVTLVDAAVYYNGARYDIDAQLAAGGGSIITSDENLASLLRQQRVSDGPLLDVNGVPGSPDPALTPLLPVYGPSGSLTIAQVTALQTTLDANAAAARAYADSLGGGVELGYSQIVTSPAAVTTSAGTDVAGLAITVTVGSRPIMVKVSILSLANTAVSSTDIVNIMEGATTLLSVAKPQAAAGVAHSLIREVRLAPSAGSHTYKISLVTFSGSLQLNAAAGAPAFIQAIQL